MNNCCSTTTKHNKSFIHNINPLSPLRQQKYQGTLYVGSLQPSWHEIFAYVIYRAAKSILLEYQSRGSHITKEKTPLESRLWRLPDSTFRFIDTEQTTFFFSQKLVLPQKKTHMYYFHSFRKKKFLFFFPHQDSPLRISSESCFKLSQTSTTSLF